MHKLTICNNKTCKIEVSDPEVLRLVYANLSFKMIGVEYTQAYKNGWDGITHLMDKKGNFPLGLLPKVEQLLHDKQQQYELLDKRASIIDNNELDITSNLTKYNKEPRDYQLAIVDAALKNRKGIVRAATGSGKTLAAALITAKVNKPTIIYVIGLSLLNQFHQLFSEILNQPIGYIGNGVCKIENINIASIWTIGKALNIKRSIFTEDELEEKENFNIKDKLNILKMLQNTKLHIFDECHGITCDTFKEIYKSIDPERIYGFSGTPFRDDGSDLLINGMLGEQIINISASQLIERGVLAQPVIQFVNVPGLKLTGRTYHSVYSDYIVNNDMRNQLILNKTKMLLDKGYQTLVLFKQIRHGKILLDAFKENGFNCELLDGSNDLDERENIKKQLLSRQLNLILASSIFDVGIDISSLSGLVLASGGKSSIRTLQRVGRIIRGEPGKKYAAVIDFIDNTRYLKQHSEKRFQIYSSEKGFIVRYPKQKYMK